MSQLQFTCFQVQDALGTYCCYKRRDSSVDIATDCGLADGMIGFRIRAGAGSFSVRHCVQTGSWAHPASYTMGAKGSFLVGKAAGAWSWPHLRLVPRWRMRGAIFPILQYAFIKKKHRDNFNFNFTFIWCMIHRTLRKLALLLSSCDWL